MAPKATFAQLCQDLTEIKDATEHHVFELYSTVTPGATYPFSQIGGGQKITTDEFLGVFYGGGSGPFKITTDCSGIMLLNNWRVLDYPFVNPGAPTDVSYNTADILTLVPQQWVLDLSHNNTCCWTACSYMEMQKELLEARNLCNWNCDICCAMSTQELASILNHQDPSAVSPRTALIPVQQLDEVVLSVLFTNPNLSAKPIELHLNFFIA